MRKGRSLIVESPGMNKTLPMLSRGRKSERTFLRNRAPPIVWIPEANEDLLDARAWYDKFTLS